MVDAYYLLGDEMMVKTHGEEILNAKDKNQIHSALAIQALAAVDNRIHLMNQEFDLVKMYYAKSKALVQRKSQFVEMHYYLGLIAFYEKDFSSAQSHFSFIATHGGTTYYVEKANAFLTTLEKFEQ